MTLDSVAPNTGTTGQAIDMALTGSGLNAAAHLLSTLALGEVSTDIDKAASFGMVYGVSVAGDLAYVAVGGKGLRVLSVANLAAPTAVGSWDTLGYALGVSVAGGLAYVADGGAGLQIVDVSDPAKPTLKGHLDTPGYAVGVAVAGGLAYVADLTSLQIIDVSDPANPQPKGALAMSGPVGRVSVAGGTAYVVDGGSTIKVIDVSTPSKPVLGESITAFGKAYGVAISAGSSTLYVADGGSGVRTIDLSNPASPQLSGSFDTPGKAADVSVVGERLYIADLSSLQVADIVGGGLVKAGEVAVADTAFSVQAIDVQEYVAEDGNGLVVPAPRVIVPVTKSDSSVSFTLPALTIAGRYSLAAVDSNNNPVLLAAPVVIAPSILQPEGGWNLLGARTVFAVNQVFNDATHYASVWKWADNGSGGKTWAVYLPGGKDGNNTLDGGASYATSKGFGLLTAIGPGEGFWVNCQQAGTPVALPGALAEGGLSVGNGWNLVAVKGGQDTAVVDLVAAKKSSVVSLWKWTDNGVGGKTWAVSLPGAGDGGASYATGKGFGQLTTIAPGEGFWINVTTAEATLTLP